MTQSQMAADVPRLVRDAQRGDADARDALIAAHLTLVYNVIGRALAGHPDVDDLVQETMLKALRGLPGLREPERFRSWLVAIAYRQVQLHLRARRMARRRLLTGPVEVADPAGDFAERTTAELVLDGQRRELVEATHWLDGDDRRLLGLWWQEASGDLTRAELAAALDVAPKHAAVRVQRMKAQLDGARGVVRALHAQPRCPDLSALLGRWDGVADPLWRKRLGRHVRDCALCSRRGQGLIAPDQLLLGVAALPVPAAIVTGILAKAGTSAGAFVQHKVLAAAVTAAAVTAGGGIVFAVYHEPAPEEFRAAVPPAVATTAPAQTPAVTAPATRATPSSTGSAQKAVPTFITGVRKADIFVAPGGSDDADGTQAHPYASVAKAVAVVGPGQTIAVRGGTYRPEQGISITTDGTAAKPIVLSNYGNEQPVIDAADVPADQWAITQRTAYWRVQGLEVVRSRSHAYVCRSCSNNVFQRLKLHGNARSGLMLRDAGTTGNQILDNDFFDNRDPAGASGAGASGAGIGLGVQFGDGGGNLIRGNRAYGNAGAGFDLGAFTGPVTMEHNWSYRNGGSGFVLGGGSPAAAAAHHLRHDAAWDNGSNGFDDEGNTAAVELTNNTAFRNRAVGFAMRSSAARLRSNAAIGNAQTDDVTDKVAQSRNSWQGNDVVLRSTDPTVTEGPRPGTGALPRTDYLATGNGVGASMDAA
ncbi:sigma-70 family RNA polymerase sigma factor [Winogradskya humida]|nr:sigma-70 family RNA polymerase sigma factor [Actinoplanes humidus]